MKEPILDMSTDSAWEEWGRRDPYFGVITDPRFRRATMDKEAKIEFFAPSEPHARYMLATIRKHIDPSFSPRNALDFGCGVGRLLPGLAAIAGEVVGADVSPSMLEEARVNCDERNLGHIRLVQSDDRLSGLTETFDLIHSFIVFQHIPPTRGRSILSNLLQHLRPGGVAAIHLTYSKVSFADAHGACPPDYPLPRAATPATSHDADPEMQMNPYDMNQVLFLMQREGIERFHAEFSDHGGELGVFLFFGKPAPAPSCLNGEGRAAGCADSSTSARFDVDELIGTLAARDYLPVPRDDELYCGGGDYKKIGLDFLRYFIEVGDLRPRERVVEIGCGLGRLAAPLTQYLNPPGSYLGVDIVRSAIDWCNANIASRYAAFQFHHKDVYNGFYNKSGTIAESDVSVPLADGSTDFVVLASVFTHLHRDTVLAYLPEIRRLLSSGGRCFATWFLIDDVSSELMQQTRVARAEGKKGPSIFILDPNTAGTEFYVSEDEPLAAIGFRKEDALQWIADAGLRVVKYVPGHWSGRMDGYTQQDIMLLERADD